ncbi:FUT1 [Bugula neritina]|uniref:L-Fucosyltransferase n=1 Tax=Bugula neritina TaxID=10212 RepID=A0A7J7KTT8_BUGNE|nr:FUT1 [Bugula neritina]
MIIQALLLLLVSAPRNRACRMANLKVILLSLIALVLISLTVYLNVSPTSQFVCNCNSSSTNDKSCIKLCTNDQMYYIEPLKGKSKHSALTPVRVDRAHNLQYDSLITTDFATPTTTTSSTTSSSSSTTASTSSIGTSTAKVTAPAVKSTTFTKTNSSGSSDHTTNSSIAITNTTLTKTNSSGSSDHTTNSSITTTTTTTVAPKVPEIILNAGNCTSCFQGKVLVATDRGWLCGQARVGNKIFMLASAIAAAAKYNATFVMAQEGDKCEWVTWLQELFITFNTTVPLLPFSMMKNWTSAGEGGFTNYYPIEVKGKNLTVGGYRQSWKYFQSEAEQKAIRYIFKFTPRYETSSHQTLHKAREKFGSLASPIFVGVHIRIGDLLEDLRLQYGYRAANSSFYSTALKTVTSYFNSSNIIFVAATDSPKLAKEMFQDFGGNYSIYWAEGSGNEDFAMLSSCNHSIISGGTFGFWAAWFAGGETFYFSEFAKPNTSFASGFISDNFYLPRWKPIGWS